MFITHCYAITLSFISQSSVRGQTDRWTLDTRLNKQVLKALDLEFSMLTDVQETMRFIPEVTDQQHYAF